MKEKENKSIKIDNSEVDYMSTVVAQKWGNSLGIRIPKEAAEKIGIEQGSELLLSVNNTNGTITLQPKKLPKEYNLDELLSQITLENRHKEIDLGLEGREIL